MAIYRDAHIQSDSIPELQLFMVYDALHNKIYRKGIFLFRINFSDKNRHYLFFTTNLIKMRIQW